MVPAYIQAAKERLGDEFQVIVEDDHVHIELDTPTSNPNHK
jgi:hypothetical protein